MRTKLFAGVAFAALSMPAAAFAQSTGSIEFEGTEIVVTGNAEEGVAGVEIPDTPKSKVVITGDLIQRQRPGQSVNDIINLSPGVSFQNNDATGSSGGTFTIRGFDSTRISQTVDGIPLNDTGNYAIYSNQQQDSETLDSVNVNLGATDIDSPTASASGGTVNIRTRVPGDELGALASGMFGAYAGDGSGERLFHRVFGMIDTGDFTGFGTKAFVSASYVTADSAFNNVGRVDKQQYNARIYQEIGSEGDFISIAGHYNENRNLAFGGGASGPIRTDLTQFPNNTVPRTSGTGSGNRLPLTNEERFYDVNYPCNVAAARPGVVDSTNSCGTEFDRRYNPSNTGNIRGNSRFTLMEGLTLTVDPSYQYVKANGGGTITGREQARTIGATNFYGYSGNSYYVGVDLNGDGDRLDQVTLISPSQTQTHRYIVNSSLSYEINEFHRVRLNFTYDHGRHRQTGELGYVTIGGDPIDVFPMNDPILDALGEPQQKRDRLSYAILAKPSAEYRGEFGDLTVVLGVAAPFFTRELNNYCFTTSASGFVDCISPTQNAAYAAANPYSFNATTGRVTGYAPPQSRTYKYDEILPSAGLTYNITPDLSVAANYAKGISVPGTDILYNAFYFPVGSERAQPVPESTDSFDLNLRYNTGRLSATLAGWYTNYKNRIATAYDPELDLVITRNLGAVEKWGIDAAVSYEPIPDLQLYVFGSYLSSKIQDDLLAGEFDFDPGAGVDMREVYYATAGKRESGAPVFTVGGRIQGTIGAVDLGLQVKHTGKRYINDENLPVQQCYNAAGTGNGSVQRGTFCATSSGGGAFTPGTLTTVYGATAPGYTLVDLDIRVNLADVGLEKSYFQVNVTNLFDEFYVGGFGGSSNRFSVPFVNWGVPRAVTAALVVGF